MRDWFTKSGSPGDGPDGPDGSGDPLRGIRKDKLKNRLTLSLDDSVKEAAKIYADRLGTSVSALVEAYLGYIAVSDDVMRRRATASEVARLEGNVATAPGGSLFQKGMPENAGAYYDSGTLLVDEDNPLSPPSIQLRAMLRAGGHEVRQEWLVQADLVIKANAGQAGRSRAAEAIHRQQQQFVALLEEATSARASDLYVSVGRFEATVRMRVAGHVRELRILPASEAAELCAAAFNMGYGSDQSYRNLDYQAALISSVRVCLPEGVQMVRLQFNPLAHGGRYMHAKVVYAAAASAGETMEEFGFLPEHAHALRQAIGMRTGFCILSGWEGNGVSTTMQRIAAAMATAQPSGRHIASVENPPEMVMPGVSQFPTLDTISEDSHREKLRLAMNSVMLTRPDVLLVGGIRDSQSADLCALAAATGRQVWATLVANDAHAALSRLVDMGVGSLSQLGAPVTVCWQCLLDRPSKDSRKVSEMEADGLDEEQTALVERLAECGIETDNVRLSPRGARPAGRIPVFEVLQPTPDTIRAIESRDMPLLRRISDTSSFIPAQVHASRLVARGLADPGSALAAFGSLCA